MRTLSQPRKETAITLLEVLLVTAAVVIFAGLVVPRVMEAKAKANRITCTGHLKCVGLGFRIFSADNGGFLPWQLSGTNGTKDQLADPTGAWRHFLFASNEMGTSLILACPADRERSRASDFADFGPKNLSYYLGLLADGASPQSILGGDRNVTTNDLEVGTGLLLVGTNQPVGFSGKIHKGAANIVLGDGSVQQVTSRRFQETVVNAAIASTNAVNQLLVP